MEPMVDVEVGASLVTEAQAPVYPARNRLERLLGWKHFWLLIIVLATLAMHFMVILLPGEPVFDEQHYIPDARAIISGEGTQRAEHPPLGKLFIVAGIKIFGDNPIGWRFFSILMGAAVIVMFYFICRQLRMSQRATNLATFLLALENLTFVQASVALLDIFIVVFMMAAFLLYLKKGYVLSGLSIGLSTLAKLTGGFAFISTILHWFLFRQDRPLWFLASIILAPLSFFIFMVPLDYLAFGRFMDPVQRIKDMLSLMGSLTFSTVTHDAASRPWDWILLPKAVPYWWDPHYIGVVSYTVWGLIIPAIVYMFFRARRGNDAARFALCWFAGTYLIWIPLQFITDRITFSYYFYPTVGAVCIGIALGLSHLVDIAGSTSRHKKRAIIGGVTTYLVGHAAVFIVLAPVFPWFKLP